MNDKCSIIILLSLFVAGLSSCVENVETPRIWRFDEQAFLDVSSDWTKMNISDYSFQYSISTYMPDGIIGDVTVDSGIGKLAVSFNGGQITQDSDQYVSTKEFYEKDCFETDKIWISSIENMFALISNRIAVQRPRYNSGEYGYYEMKIEYDETYHYPKQISEHISLTEDDDKTELSDGQTNGELHLSVKRFYVTKEK